MTQPPNPPYGDPGQPPAYGTPPPGGYGVPAPGGYGVAPPAGPFYISVFGQEQGPLEYGQLCQMAVTNQIRPETMIRSAESQQCFPARDVPGLYSDKEWLTTVVLAWFLGAVAVDRFYLGYTTLGIIKLLVSIVTCFFGGVVWQIIDLVLVMMRKLPDAQGRPLR